MQLAIANNFISSIANDEEHLMHSKSDPREIIINDEADEVIEEFINHSNIGIKIIQNQEKVMSLPSIMFIYCIINVIK